MTKLAKIRVGSRIQQLLDTIGVVDDKGDGPSGEQSGEQSSAPSAARGGGEAMDTDETIGKNESVLPKEESSSGEEESDSEDVVIRTEYVEGED